MVPRSCKGGAIYQPQSCVGGSNWDPQYWVQASNTINWETPWRVQWVWSTAESGFNRSRVKTISLRLKSLIHMHLHWMVSNDREFSSPAGTGTWSPLLRWWQKHAGGTNRTGWMGVLFSWPLVGRNCEQRRTHTPIKHFEDGGYYFLSKWGESDLVYNLICNSTRRQKTSRPDRRVTGPWVNPRANDLHFLYSTRFVSRSRMRTSCNSSLGK
jgi:hypothetical protein